MHPRNLLWLSLVAFAGCDAAGPLPVDPALAPPTVAGHVRMLALLDDIARTSQDDHPYLGRAAVRQAEGELAALSSGNPAEARQEKLLALRRAGEARLRIGDERQAIDHLSLLHALVRQDSAETRDAADAAFALGVAYLRLGETENCCLENTPESCILPIRDGGRHRREKGSRQAITYFREVLDNPASGGELRDAAGWLLNVAAMTIGAYPEGVPPEHRVPSGVFETAIAFPRFQNVAPALELNTVNLSGGAAAEDFDRDGDLDLVVSTWDPNGGMRFFRNNADGSFVDRTVAAGLEGLRGGLNLVPGDYDGDGDVDLLVLRGAWLGVAGRHPNSLLENDGAGVFVDVTFAAGLGDVHYPTQTGAWADYDRDGDLDLFVGNEQDETLPAPCQLFRNQGDGTFQDVARDAGVENSRYTKGVSWGDCDEDGWPDLYVSNLDGANRLYRNTGQGTFDDVAETSGVTLPLKSFPAWFWDYDGDGHLDIFAGSYGADVAAVGAYHLGRPAEFESSRLYKGDGQGGFQDVTEAMGLAYPALPMGSNFGDLDGDGLLDVYLGTGDPDYKSLMPNVMYLNRGERGFVNVTMSGGFGHLQKGHAVVFADLDHDGDLDVFEQMGGAYPGDRFGDVLYENPGFGSAWVALRLVGTESPASALGARIRVTVRDAEGPRSIYRYVSTGGSFGASPLCQTIGLGAATEIEAVEVRWPRSGRRESFVGVAPGEGYELTEGGGKARRVTMRAFRLGQ